MENKPATAPVLLRGVITGLTKRRESYEAIFTEADKQAMERTAVVAALAGLNDIALNLSTSTEFTETTGDLVTFRLNGEGSAHGSGYLFSKMVTRSKLSRSGRGLDGSDTQSGGVVMVFCLFTLIASVGVERYLNFS
ncbi:hypothetical protein BLA9940_02951 [Burkholderia aenigmatica]|uniref:Uncharacterized protein n=1 Tax=Burkholderia aenigmatica TaxID=2015348 RepID=A0A6J5IP49_9BURK|nr:hypothetical protein BLA3211_00267 [Burkholderia aenigmatica]VWC59821.1 hypothetical protein BLA9940_02951 [Burkholderia aenigmatica]